MPPIGSPAGIGGSGSGLSATSASVVRRRLAIDAAFCRAALVTLAGSMTPALTRSSCSPFEALNPTLPFASSTSRTIIDHSNPAFSAMSFAGAARAVETIRAPVASSP